MKHLPSFFKGMAIKAADKVLNIKRGRQKEKSCFFPKGMAGLCAPGLGLRGNGDWFNLVFTDHLQLIYINVCLAFSQVVFVVDNMSNV